MAVVDLLNFTTGWYEDQGPVDGPTAQTELAIGPFPNMKCVLLIHASASSQAQAQATAGAGIQLSIHLNPLLAPISSNPVSYDECYEGQPGGIMTFQSSASFAFPLKEGTKVEVVAKVDGYGSKAVYNRNTYIRLQCLALGANW